MLAKRGTGAVVSPIYTMHALLALCFGFSCSTTDSPSSHDRIDDISDAVVVSDGGEECWSGISHHGGIAAHDFERGADMGCQIDLVSV